MMDDNFTDYFEPENVPDDKPKEETPEQREEREIKETTIDRTRGGRRRLFLWSLVVVLAGFLVYTVWSRYFHPYRTDCQERGVIMDVANEGTLVKTYECKMISEKYISDTVHIYTSDFAFTIKTQGHRPPRHGALLRVQGHGALARRDQALCHPDCVRRRPGRPRLHRLEAAIAHPFPLPLWRQARRRARYTRARTVLSWPRRHLAAQHCRLFSFMSPYPE